MHEGPFLRRSRRFLTAPALTALALSIAAGASATSASAATSRSTASAKSAQSTKAGQAATTTTSAASTTTTTASGPATAVPDGMTPSTVPGATVFGDTDPSTPETVSFVLTMNDEANLANEITSGANPNLSVSQFAAQYGQSGSFIKSLTGYLANYGITTSVYGDDLDVVANGTAGEFDQALQISQKNYSAPAQPGWHGHGGRGPQNFHGNTTKPLLPRSLAKGVTAILGLDNYAAMDDNLVKTNASVTQPQAGSSNSCVALSGLSSDCNLPSDYAKATHLKGLYKTGAEGQGQTIAIVTLASLDTGAPEYFWQNVAGLPKQSANRAVTQINVDGGSGAPSYDAGSSETDLDVEQSGAVAPDANVEVYQAPNTDSGFADAFFQAASDNTASTVSTSWGEAETVIQAGVASGEETPAYNAAFDEAYLEMAAQGQSTFDASGDDGAYDDDDGLDTTNLTIDTTSDSPYTTATGGTTLPWSATLTSSTTGNSVSVDVPAERIWGWDYLWAPVASLDDISLLDSADEQIAGSGGGFSVFYSEPSYQQQVSGTSSYTAINQLTPDDYQDVDGLNLPTDFALGDNSTVTGNASGRATPDLTSDGDPYTGYLEYSPSFTDSDGPGPALEGGWGGTSFVAPQMAGSAAVIDSSIGHRAGFWNPVLYKAAASAKSPFTPLNTTGTTNDNLYYTGTAGDEFTPGAGLGIPNLKKLATDF